jgi:predicted transcriptional regulator
MDKYDFVILDIIQTFRKNNKNQYIKLNQLEANFWTRIQREFSHQSHSAHLGERVTRLYLDGFIVNKNGQGYTLTKKGKEELASTSLLVESNL